MDPRQPVIWLSGSINVPTDTSTVVENTTIRVVTVIVSNGQWTMDLVSLIFFYIIVSRAKVIMYR